MKNLIVVLCLATTVSTSAGCYNSPPLSPTEQKVLIGIAAVLVAMAALDYVLSDHEYSVTGASLAAGQTDTMGVRCRNFSCPDEWRIVEVDIVGGEAGVEDISFTDRSITVTSTSAGELHLAVTVLEDGRQASFAAIAVVYEPR